MKKFFHISSSGLERNDIFKSDEEFRMGMNDIAICSTKFDVKILCFCLMSNHYHFVLKGRLSECMNFTNEYKRRCSIRMRHYKGEVKGLKDLKVQINEIDTPEYLENVIAYVLRNPLAAGIKMLPVYYPWSSASIYFNDNEDNKSVKLQDMSERKRYRTLASRLDIPTDFVVDSKGMILKSCYVDKNTVETIFRHPSRLMMILSKKVENDVEISFGTANEVFQTDQELETQMITLIKKEFGEDSIEQLSMEQRLSLCLLLKRNFRAGVKQISRLTRIAKNIVEKIV